MSDHKQLLDPIGTMCKLVALNFCDNNTKISIHNHVITFQEPDKLQWLVRSCYGDGRENISELYYVIVKLILWFLVEDDTISLDTCILNSNNSKIRQSDEIKRMVGYLCNALTKLQLLTYQYGNVTLALQYYINILTSAVDEGFSEILLPKHLREQDKINDNLLDLDKLKNLWELKDIKRICELYDNCFALLSSEEEDNSNKQSLIQSYLKSIDSILKITDDKFQKLIRNSSNG
jgi:hypothetical protein